MPESNRSRTGLGSSALTPLLDTLFLLLFTLLATSRSATIVEHALREEVAVELPSIEDGGAAASPDSSALPMTIAVEKDGTVGVIEGRGAGAELQAMGSTEALRRFLEGRATGTESTRVEIRADGEAQHGVVLEVLQAVRASGVLDVRFIAIEDESTSPRSFGAGAPSGGGQ